jgi:excisionase family DNA binding protein
VEIEISNCTIKKIMQNNVLTINIPFESLLIALEEKIETAISKAIREQSQITVNENLQDDLITRKEACSLLGISLPTLSKYVTSGKLPYSRIGKKFLFHKQLILKACKGGKQK